MNAATTVGGAFLAAANTKGETASLLFSAGAFSSGDRAVQSGDVIKVQYDING